VLRDFNLYVLFVLCFVQLIVSTTLVLSPIRDLSTGSPRRGSRLIEVTRGGVVAAAVSAVGCFLTNILWGLPIAELEMAACILVILSVVVLVLRPDCNVIGNVFYASYLGAGFVFLAFAGEVAVAATGSVGEAITSTLLIVCDVAAWVVWTSNVNYISDVLCRTRPSRLPPEVDPTYLPMVSLHIPIHNEPPDLVIATIKAAEEIDYPDFELVVIDNNTPDPAVYGPVEEYCRSRERVRFVHVAPWPGYKAGACNLALRSYTDPRAEIIGIIDADDLVQPHYLRETVPYFCNPQLGYLQTFEGNRNFEGNSYYTACVDSYQPFYLTIMSSRNERDSVPFVGTMGLFRRSALTSVGGWNEWCIGEDTEASLRVSKAGWSGLYVPRCFGRGIVPPTFAGMKTQRHRWCFGGMQILRLHWRSLMPWDRSPDNHLSSGQRRDYLMASVGWARDLLMLVFAFLLLAISGLLIAGSGFALTPLAGDSSLLPMSLIVIATICMMWTLRLWTTMSRRRAIGALLISWSAAMVIGIACIEGMLRREGVFLRTSKTGGDRYGLRDALRMSRWEALFAAALYAAAALLAAKPHPPLLLIGIVSLQGTVFACAPIAALWSLRAQRVPTAEYRRRYDERLRPASPMKRRSLARLAIAVVIAAALGVSIASVAAPSRLLPVSAAQQMSSVRPERPLPHQNRAVRRLQAVARHEDSSARRSQKK
jgi:cellulose synthase/poly-beta-1,6-N-acetylglucosamine synthase-like glycosyltransferase